MEELLHFIRDNKFLLYHDGKWYSTEKRFNKLEKGSLKRIYYDDSQLINLMYEHREIGRTSIKTE